MSAAAAATGAVFLVSGEAIRSDGESGVSQRAIAERNERVADRRIGAYIAFGVAGVAAGVGVLLLVGPTKSGGELSASARPSGVALTWRPR